MKWYTLLFAASFLPSLLQAQFTFAQRLTDSDSISYLPYNNSHAIAASGLVVHVVFTDRRDGAGEVFYKRSLDGGMTWDPDRRLTADDNVFSGRATIAAWNDEVHIVWMDRRDGNNELYYSRSTNNGTTWSADVRLTTTASISEYPSMALDFQTLHLVWNDDRNGDNEIYYKRSINGGLSWTADMRLTNHAGDSFKPSVAVSDTLVHVLWEDLRNGTSEIFYKNSGNSGNTWSNDERLSNDASECYAPCISANGAIAIATWDDLRTGKSQVYGRRTIDGGNTWTAEVNHSNNGGDSYNAYHAFSGTYVCMVYTTSFNNDPDLYGRFSTDAGTSWAGFGVTTNFSASEQAFVAIAGAAVHMVWQDDQDDNLEIYYSRNPNGNPFDNINHVAWAHAFGDTNTDVAYAMTSDVYSNVYVAGGYSGTVDFDPGPDIMNLTANGSSDIFVYKLNPDGELLWAKSVGGQETDIAFGIALDTQWNVVLTGSFHTIVDFDPGDGIVNIGALGQEDIFVLQLSNEGDYRWVKRLGGGGRDEARSVAISLENDVLITGLFSETADFDPGPGTFNLVSQGEEDMFITQLSSFGEFKWTKQIGGNGFDATRSISPDGAGNFLITGYFADEVDFDPDAGIYLMTSNGGADIFIAMLNEVGGLVWMNQFGSGDDDEGNSVTTDEDGFVYGTGFFSGEIDFDPGVGVWNLESAGESDIYVVKLDPNGMTQWARGMGGSNEDEGRSIAYSADYVYVTGYFENTADFHPGNPEVELHASGDRDIFIQKLPADAGSPVWLTQLGGTMEDVAYTVKPIHYGKIGVAGYFEGTAEFSPEIEQHAFTSAGNKDAFVTVIRECIPSYAMLELSVCGGYIAYAPDSIITESGIYTIIAESATGCDSVITLMLTVLQNAETSVTETACDSYTTPSGTHTWTATGIYSEAAIAANGCDSIITYNLTILTGSSSEQYVSACEMYTDEEGNTLTASGEYVYHHTNEAGCDSTVTLLLSIGHHSTQTFGVEACDYFAVGDSIWYEHGFYTYTFTTAAGCDSVLHFDVYVGNFNTAVEQTDTALIATTSSPLYQWVDCNNGYAAIPGATEYIFTPEMDGSYAALFGFAGCYDTSACFTVTIVNLLNPGPLAKAIVYPNPVRERVYIDLPNGLSRVDVVLSDIHGRQLQASQFSYTSKIEVDLTQPPGVYLLTLIADQHRKTFRLVKM